MINKLVENLVCICSSRNFTTILTDPFPYLESRSDDSNALGSLLLNHSFCWLLSCQASTLKYRNGSRSLYWVEISEIIYRPYCLATILGPASFLHHQGNHSKSNHNNFNGIQLFWCYFPPCSFLLCITLRT